MTVQANGDYVWSGTDGTKSLGPGAARLSREPCRKPAGVHAGNNILDRALRSRQPREGDGQGGPFFNTLTVVIPATIIPILIAAFAA